MSTINTLREYLAEYGGLELVLTDLRFGSGGCGAELSANGAVKQDIMGSRTYQNSYLFQVRGQGGNQADWKDNDEFLEAFCEWLENRNDSGDLPRLAAPYTAVSLEVFNVTLMSVDDAGEATYQVQIQFVYRKNSEVHNQWLK